MKKLTTMALFTCFSISLVVLMGCASEKMLVAEVRPSVSPVLSPGETWEVKWEEMQASARKEGKLVILSNISGQTRADLSQAFKQSFGLNLEFSAAGRGAELTQRILTERRAGLFTTDVIITGSGTLLLSMKPEGILDTIEPLLVFPEALNPKAWHGGSPFMDKDRKVINLIAYFSRHLTRNTKQVKEDEIKSYRDLLNPTWKGKIVMNDPSIAGASNSWVSFLVNIWGLDQTKEYLQQMVKQDPILIRDRRLQVEWLANGKYPLCIGASTEPVEEFLSAGAEIAYVLVKEGSKSSSGGGSLAIPSKRPHYNAAAVFVNWLLSKDGMIVFSKSFGRPSTWLHKYLYDKISLYLDGRGVGEGEILA